MHETVSGCSGWVLAVTGLVLLARILYGEAHLPGAFCDPWWLASRCAGVRWKLAPRVYRYRGGMGLRGILPARLHRPPAVGCSQLGAHRPGVRPDCLWD